MQGSVSNIRYLFGWILIAPGPSLVRPPEHASADTIEKRPASASILRSMRCIDDEMAAAFDAAAEAAVADNAAEDDDGAYEEDDDDGADANVDADEEEDEERRAEARRARIDETD